MTSATHTEATKRPAPSAAVAPTDATPRAVATAGGRLKAAREAAGLSVDAVAQQLKLAPRQVKALEDDDWNRLPGRTFVRGFARNYARFVHLDPEAVVALLPASDAAPALERPTLAASPRPMGEIPVDGVAKPSPLLRFAIPLVVLAAIAAFGYHELSQSPLRLPARLSSFFSGATSNVADATSAATPSPTAPPASSAATTSTLPNPIAEGAAGTQNPAGGASDGSAITVLNTPSAPDAGPSSGAGNVAASVPAASTTSTPTTSPPTTSTPTTSTPTTSTPTTSTPTTSTTTTATSAPSAAAIAADVPLVLTFRGTSWAEVKDAKGRVVLQMTGGAGMTQTVTATPPIELALGNARNVGVTFRGQSLDLSPYTRGSVARVSLQ